MSRIWIPNWLRKKSRPQRVSLHSVWDVQVLRADGSVRFDWTGKRALHNVVHDYGARYILDLLFENAFTTSTNSPYCALTDGAFTQATKVMTSAGHGFVNCATGDWLYLIGGTGAAGAVTPRWYQIALWTSQDQVTMADDISSNAENLTKVMCVPVPMRRAVLYLGLDARAVVSQSDTITVAEGSEAGVVGVCSGYARAAVDPDTSGQWAVSYDSTAKKYKALSVLETITASGTDWAEMKNLFLAAGYHGTADTAPANGAATSGQVLISSVKFPAPFTLGNTESVPVQGKFYLHADA